MSCLATLPSAGLVTWRVVERSRGQAVKCAEKKSSEKCCFQDKMCVKVKCSKCQKTTWKGKHVINILSLPCGGVLGGHVRPDRMLQLGFSTEIQGLSPCIQSVLCHPCLDGQEFYDYISR